MAPLLRFLTSLSFICYSKSVVEFCVNIIFIETNLPIRHTKIYIIWVCLMGSFLMLETIKGSNYYAFMSTLVYEKQPKGGSKKCGSLEKCLEL